MNNSVLKKLQINNSGHYENGFYIVDLEDSNEYAKMYSLLSKEAVNTEYPNFKVNTNKTTVEATNYFELDIDEKRYLLFLFANFEEDKYYLKIKKE